MFAKLFATHPRTSPSTKAAAGRSPPQVPPQDHRYGWLVVLGAFIIQAVTFGLMNSFTTFTKLMEHDDRLGSPSKADLSLGASVSSGIGPFLGVCAGYAVDRFGAKPLIVLLSLGMAFAFLAGAEATSVTQLVLLYSVPLSVASACCNSPVATSVGSWFDTKLSIAMGVTYMGGGIGAALIPWLAGHLAANLHDWRECYRYLAILTILPLTVGTLLLRVRPSTGVGGSDSNSSNAASPTRDHTTANSSSVFEGANNEEAEVQQDKKNSNVQEETREGGGGGGGCAAVEVTPPPRGGGGIGAVVRGHSVLTTAASSATETDGLLCSPEPTQIQTPFMEQLKRACKIALFSKTFWYLGLTSWCFTYNYFGFLYVLIPYVMEFGHPNKNSHYGGRDKIPIEEAVTFYTFYGVFGAIGHLSMGVMGYAFDSKRVFTFCSALASVGLIVFVFASQYWHLAIVVSILGFAGAGCWNAVPALLVERFNGPDLGTVMGLGFCPIGVAALMAPLVTAHMAESQQHNYTWSIVLMAFTSAAGGLVCTFLVPNAKH